METYFADIAVWGVIECPACKNKTNLLVDLVDGRFFCGCCKRDFVRIGRLNYEFFHRPDSNFVIICKDYDIQKRKEVK